MSRATFGASLLFVLSAGLAGCGGGGSDGGGGNPVAPPPPAPPPPAVIARVIVTPANATLEVGRTMAFHAQAQDVTGAPVASTFTWESSDSAKATVDSAGIATGIAPGPVAITATAAAVRSTAASLAVTPATSAPTGTSFERIDAALASGAIDAETALSYRTFATFQDARLPAQFRGDDTTVTHSEVLVDIQMQWDALSPAAQQALGPFLMPPAYAASASGRAPMVRTNSLLVRKQDVVDTFLCARPELDPNWASLPLGTLGNVRVWYDSRIGGDGAYAAKVADIANNEVWNKLFVSLGMKLPLKDKTTGSANEGCNGGDDRLDIYLATMNTSVELGLTQVQKRGVTRNSPVYIQIARGLDDSKLRASLSHELMHASQWAYAAKSNAFDQSHKWLRESTAMWATDYVYPANNYEQTKAPQFFANPEEPLESLNVTGARDRIYGAYLFFQFVANRGGGAPRIPLIWAQTEVVEAQLDAVNAGLPGGFADAWHKFAKYHWNQGPVAIDSYDVWDPGSGGSSATLGAPKPFGGQPIQVELAGQPSREWEMNANVKHLAIHYHHFKFLGTGGYDPNVRSVTLEQTPVAGGGFARVQAFFKRDGSIWQAEDWTPGTGTWQMLRKMCFDIKDERLEELVIIISNGDTKIDAQAVAGERVRLGVNNLGCWRWSGTASHRMNSSGPLGVRASVESTVINVLIERVPVNPSVATVLQDYQLIAGDYAQSYRATDSIGCTQAADVSGVSAVSGGNNARSMQIQNFGLQGLDAGLSDNLPLGGYRGRFGSSGPWTVTLSCNGRIDSFPNFYGDDWFKAGIPETFSAANARNGILEETVVSSDGVEQFTWRFTPLRQP